MSNPTTVPDFERLLVHAALVRRVARAVLGSGPDAEDAVQETWLAAARSELPRPEASRSWLRTVARRAALRTVRSRDRRRHYEQAAPARQEAAPTVEEVACQEAMRRRLVEAVLALEEPSRTAVLLRFHQGLSPRRVAELTNVPLETARTRIKRGIARVREALAP